MRRVFRVQRHRELQVIDYLARLNKAVNTIVHEQRARYVRYLSQR
jgi:hypothetical protein